MGTLKRKDAERLDFPIDINRLDELIDLLIHYRKTGKSVCINFNGVDLFSADITPNSAYIDVMGFTKEEYKPAAMEFLNAKDPHQKDEINQRHKIMKERNRAKRAREIEEIERMEMLDEVLPVETRERQKCMDSLAGWMQRAEKTMYPERFRSFKNYIEQRIGRESDVIGLAAGVNIALAVMENMNSGMSLEDAVSSYETMIIDNPDINFSRKVTSDMIFRHAKLGPEFFGLAEPELSKTGSYPQAIQFQKTSNARLAKREERQAEIDPLYEVKKVLQTQEAALEDSLRREKVEKKPDEEPYEEKPDEKKEEEPEI